MNIQGSNSVNFGWSCETHRKIMETAIKDMPEFQKYKDTLEDYVQRPDHDDIGFLANKHFYFGEKIQKDTFDKKSFEKEDLSEDNIIKGPSAKKFPTNGVADVISKIMNTNSVSFMDFSGRNNAKAAYQDQIALMDDAIEDEDDELAIQNAARACHFLQDMTQPQHTEETSAIGKAWDLKIHTDYEAFADKHADECAKNFKTTVRNPRKGMRLFSDTFAATKETGKITRENEPQWGEITQKQFNIAVQATKEFLQNVSDQMGLAYRDKAEEHHHE